MIIIKLRIKELRENRNLEQETVAAELGCTQKIYSRYENGKAKMSYQTLDRLADYFGTSVDYLLGRTDEARPYPPGRHR